MQIKLFSKQTRIIENQFPSVILKGIGQIMLQESVYTGLLFLIGIFYGSLEMGIAVLLASCCGTITARVLKYDKIEIAQGIYGFNAALVGAGLAFYFKPVLVLWLAVVIGSILAVVIQHWFNRKRIPVYTLPFILVCWFFIYILENVFLAPRTVSLNTVIDSKPYAVFALRGFGQVIFQESLFAGVVFFIGVFVSSPIRAVYGLFGGLAAGFIAAFYNASTQEIMMGLFSYNAVLCAIVFAGNRVINIVWTFIAVVLSVFIGFTMNNYHFIPLTFPFVAATCTVLIMQKLLSKYFSFKTYP